MNYQIPDDEKESTLSLFWQMLRQIESKTCPDKDPLDALLVTGAYNLLNRIGATDARPGWEPPKDHHAINAERAEARALRKAWIKAEDENQNLRKELEAARANIERLTLAAK